MTAMHDIKTELPTPLLLGTRLTIVRGLIVAAMLIGSLGIGSGTHTGVFSSSVAAEEIDVWIGTGGQAGIFHLILDTQRGTISTPQKMDTLGGAGFLAYSPQRKTLYATARQGNASGVAAYQIVGSGKTVALRQTGFVASGDGGAACIGVDQTGKVLLSAQYGGGSIASYQLSDSGTIDKRVKLIEQGPGSGVVSARQKTAHPHWVGTSPDNRFVCVPDLGMDAVVVYRLDPQTGNLTPHSTVACPPGGGPRHMKFSPNGRWAYVLNELKLTVSVFQFDPQDAKFTVVQEIESLPENLKDGRLNAAAEIRVHPSGKFVYASNRGHDSIAVFRVDQETGKLGLVEREAIRGSWPRNFNLDPSGRWLIAAGQKSNTLALFEVDRATGELTFCRQVVSLPAPICVEFGVLQSTSAESGGVKR